MGAYNNLGFVCFEKTDPYAWDCPFANTCVELGYFSAWRISAFLPPFAGSKSCIIHFKEFVAAFDASIKLASVLYSVSTRNICN